MQLEQLIRTYLCENILYLDEDSDYSNDTSLIGEGLIDSMGVMDLVSFVRIEYHIDVDQRDITTDNFDSVSKIAAYIRRKSGCDSLLVQRSDSSARATWV